MNADFYGDTVRGERQKTYENRYTQWYDLIYYDSSVTPGLKLAMRVDKPVRKGHILASTHGWHMTIPSINPDEGPSDEPYLHLHVDMRGRSFSTGRQDCNGLELIDVYDAIQYARVHYADYLEDTETIYYEGGSGGGGNGYALAVKFPDLFAAVTALCGISDYALWYRNDAVGEFRDEMEPWIGCTPDEDAMAYASRSGAEAVGNLMAPLFCAHGSTDERVPVEQSRLFVERAEAAGKAALVEYFELPNVGTQSHWGRATVQQLAEIERRSEENRRRSPKHPQLPERGELTVLGYLYTRRFRIRFHDISKVGRVAYDLKTGSFRVDAPCGYTLEVL
ncbi:MAG: alpha/beta hydrolase family protein [Eubacteriales bacterium]|jgi:pimeloyl-ACP methyl ester carboxylesterase